MTHSVCRGHGQPRKDAQPSAPAFGWNRSPDQRGATPCRILPVSHTQGQTLERSTRPDSPPPWLAALASWQPICMPRTERNQILGSKGVELTQPVSAEPLMPAARSSAAALAALGRSMRRHPGPSGCRAIGQPQSSPSRPPVDELWSMAAW